jgi:hypothetical protein
MTQSTLDLAGVHTPDNAGEDGHRMACMEVWGGSAPFDSAVGMAGLDAWVYSRPYESAEEGGDVYYVSSCATGRIARLLLADVSGHGQGVASIAGSLRLLMRKNVNRLDQGEFVAAMNNEFAALAEAGCFATAVVMTFFAPTNYLTLCNAGHPPAMLYRARERQWRLLEDAAGGLPLGVIELAEYGQVGFELEPGDLVLCYTDSLIEAKGASGDMLGPAGLAEIVRGIGARSPAEFIPALLAEIASKHPGNLDGDDVTVLLFTPNRATRKVGFFQRAGAPLRLLGAMVSALRPGGQPVPWPDFKLANIGGAIVPALARFWKGTPRRA